VRAPVPKTGERPSLTTSVDTLGCDPSSPDFRTACQGWSPNRESNSGLLVTNELHGLRATGASGCEGWIRTSGFTGNSRAPFHLGTSQEKETTFGVRRLRLTIMGDRRAIARTVTPCLVFKELGIHVSRAVPRAGFEPTFRGSAPRVLPLDDLGILTS
jgi:hypothetical protein